MGYGTGAIMAVPAHDGRDFEFAKKYQIPIVEVVRPPAGGYDGTAAYEGEGILVNSGPHDGIASEHARAAVTKTLAGRGSGEAVTRYRLRDWLISRQRYWGAPIPMMTCPQHGLQPVPDKDLPVLLPDQVEFKPTGESPLLFNEAFLSAKCPKCGGPARRETDTMDTFVDSSWYFMRFLSPKLQSAPIQSDAVNRWLPVNQYIGGVEHAILHLLYSRFIVKVLRDMGIVSFSEPFERLFTQGMICKDGHKMSKSKGNVVAPDALLARYGADTVRLYTLFIGPPEKDAVWHDRGVEGTYRFLTRYWKLIDEFVAAVAAAGPGGRATEEWSLSGPPRELRRRIHGVAAHMIEDLNRLHLNTAVSGLMQMVNAIQEYQAAGGTLVAPEAAEAIDMATRLLAPLAPHTAEGAWARLGRSGTIFRAGLPEVSREALASDVRTLVVQVNGKVRGQVEVPSEASEEVIRNAALSDPKVARALEGKSVAQVIHVPGRLVSIVAR
jgi:leucyl-tRNA synthetase